MYSVSQENEIEAYDIVADKTSPNWWGLSFLVIVVLFIGWLLFSTLNWMLDEQRLPLSKLVLQGELTHVKAENVQSAFASLEHIGTFMSQDVDQLQDALLTLPWVSHVSIRKQWPDTVKVYLVEHEAQAIWNGISMLNMEGNVFNADIAELTNDKIKLYGPEGSHHQVLEAWHKIQAQLNPIDLEVSSVLLNDRRAWQVILTSGIRLELGKESLIERIARFVALYQKLGSKSQQISHIDLRYDTGAAIGWFPDQDLVQESTDD
ncbi:cell division protein FtsQ [Vibrio nigripulchritudo ATCC 27043]|uniref:cell division protein FtsQ/DivIB n=1 Tax=Vibrio TaxID=662 RepID=UPI00021C412A|nr:cell division protein FtsQ [Vibrio nigripulchritudo ATCC 27043]UAB70837.1 cell division protein FtsQ/DivIB [Vibrio sp. SCSIO 43132]